MNEIVTSKTNLLGKEFQVSNTDPFRSNRRKEQADIKQSPEERKNQPPKSLLHEDVMIINGQPMIVRGEAYVDRDGRPVKQQQTNYVVAADGRWLRPDQFCGMSWTGLPVPCDRIAICLNPFELHEYRPVYLDIDGAITELGNVLCADCIEFQKRRLFWRKVLLLGLIYNPEEY
jgi:hypothetical protein